MTNIQNDRFYRELSKKYDLDIATIKSVCTYPFLFAKERMCDKFDYGDILFSEFIRFKLKVPFQEDKTVPFTTAMKRKRYSNKLKLELWHTDPDKYKQLYGTWYKEKDENTTYTKDI